MHNFIRTSIPAVLAILGIVLCGCDTWDPHDHDRYTYHRADAVIVLQDGNLLAAINSVETTSYARSYGGTDDSPVPPHEWTTLRKYDVNGRRQGGISSYYYSSPLEFRSAHGLLAADAAHFLAVGASDGLLSCVLDTSWRVTRALMTEGGSYPEFRAAAPVSGGLACVYDDYNTMSRKLVRFDAAGDVVAAALVFSTPSYSPRVSLAGLSNGNLIVVESQAVREFTPAGDEVWSHASGNYGAAGEDSSGGVLLFGAEDELIISKRAADTLQSRPFAIGYGLQNVMAVTRDNNHGWYIACTEDAGAMILAHWDGGDGMEVNDIWNAAGDQAVTCAATSADGWFVLGGYITRGRNDQVGFLRKYGSSGVAQWLEILDD